MSAPANRHGVALVLSDRGVLITGPSGSGKTTLALELIVRSMRAAAPLARLVADDQLFLSRHHGRLVATAPQPIAGLVEAHGAGPAPIEYMPRAVLDLWVDLVEEKHAPRIDEGEAELFEGHRMALLRLPQRRCIANAFAILARLSLPPFC